jgi:hypothetical protein
LSLFGCGLLRQQSCAVGPAGHRVSVALRGSWDLFWSGGSRSGELQSQTVAEGSGKFRFSPDIQSAFTNVGQNNTNIGGNTAIGGIIGLNNQATTQLGLNSANVGTFQNQ